MPGRRVRASERSPPADQAVSPKNSGHRQNKSRDGGSKRSEPGVIRHRRRRVGSGKRKCVSFIWTNDMKMVDFAFPLFLSLIVKPVSVLTWVLQFLMKIKACKSMVHCECFRSSWSVKLSYVTILKPVDTVGSNCHMHADCNFKRISSISRWLPGAGDES